MAEVPSFYQSDSPRSAECHRFTLIYKPAAFVQCQFSYQKRAAEMSAAL